MKHGTRTVVLRIVTGGLLVGHGAQMLFGFFGVLLALPASAALLVGLRHLRAAYFASRLYGGN